MTSTRLLFNEKESKKLNAIGLRASYGMTLLKLKKEITSLTVFTADTSTSAGLDRFRQKYPESFFDVGIAEQAMISIAAGYVAEGGVALASTFAPFLMLRSAEQIRLSLGYMNLPLIVTGLASGLSLGYLGYTHCCVEDSAIALSIPNVFYYSPSDSFELKEVLPHLIKMRRPCYIRLTGSSKTKAIHNTDINTDFYSPIPILDQGKDLLILSSGVISANILEAMSMIDPQYAKKISHYLLAFVDQEKTPTAIADLISQYRQVIFADESTIGGLATIVLNAINKNNFKSQLYLNIHPQCYLKCGSHEYMLKQIGLDPRSLAAQISSLVNEI